MAALAPAPSIRRARSSARSVGAAPKVLRVQRGHFEGVTGRVQLPADASEAAAAAAPALPAKTATVERSVTRRANVAKAPTVRRPSAKRESSGTPKVAAEPAPAPAAAAAAASPAPTKPLPPAPAASSTAVAKPSLAKRARSAARSVKKTVVALARKIGRPARSRQAESAAGKATAAPAARPAALTAEQAQKLTEVKSQAQWLDDEDAKKLLLAANWNVSEAATVAIHEYTRAERARARRT